MTPRMLEIYLYQMILNGIKILLKGDPGIGKTSIIKKVAKKLGWRLIELHFSSYTPGDIRGFLMVIDGTPQFVPIGSISEVLSTGEDTLVLMDDLGHADNSVLKPAMQFIRGRLGDFVVPDNVRMIAATNDKGTKSGVNGIFEPLKSSFWGIIEAQVSVEDCNIFARENNWRSDLRSFLAFSPEYWHKPNPTTDLVNSPSPRQNEHLNDKLNAIDQIQFPNDMPKDKIHRMRNMMIRESVKGACGIEYQEAFDMHIQVLSKCPIPSEVLANPIYINIPNFNSEQSALFATVCGVANLFHNAEYQTKENIDNLWKFVDRLPATFQRHAQFEIEEIYPDALHHSWCVQNEIENCAKDWTF